VRIETDDQDPYRLKERSLHDFAETEMACFLHVRNVFGEFSPEENRIAVHLPPVFRLAREAGTCGHAAAFAVAVHEAVHALLWTAYPAVLRRGNVPEAVQELVADAVSGVSMGLLACLRPIFENAWKAWTVLDGWRFRLGERVTASGKNPGGARDPFGEAVLLAVVAVQFGPDTGKLPNPLVPPAALDRWRPLPRPKAAGVPGKGRLEGLVTEGVRW
jgi:hypothetical protein